jgi:hypothetical protein
LGRRSTEEKEEGRRKDGGWGWSRWRRRKRGLVLNERNLLNALGITHMHKTSKAEGATFYAAGGHVH